MAMSAPVAVFALTIDGPDGHQFDITGFTKHEWSKSGSAARVVPDTLSNYTFDNRNAESKPGVDQTTRAARSSELSMQQLSLGWSKETAGAIGMEARLTYRWRGNEVFRLAQAADVDYREDVGSFLRRDYTEKFVGLKRPDLGAIKWGTQLSRSWSRSDAFSFPVGLSGVWADSGAGFGIFPSALRLTSPTLEDGSGKLTVEVTAATHERNTRLVDQNRSTGAPTTAFSPTPSKPQALELFLQ